MKHCIAQIKAEQCVSIIEILCALAMQSFHSTNILQASIKSLFLSLFGTFCCIPPSCCTSMLRG